MVEIIDYSNIYDENIKDLLVELGNYISSIDKEGYNRVTNEFREEYFNKTMDDVKKYEGKIFLAKENNNIIGLIIGLINNDEVDTYDFKAPKRGRIVEFIVSKNYRASGIGSKLFNTLEEYFKSVGCKGILIDVFSYNESALEFYKKHGYFNRTEEMMKLL